MPSRNPVSTASIAGHPLHPMLIPFPIAFFVSTLVCDLVFWGTRSDIWSIAALWLLGAGLIMAALAAVAGLTDFVGDRRSFPLRAPLFYGGAFATMKLPRAQPFAPGVRARRQNGCGNRA